MRIQCTFLAAVQAQMLSISVGGTGPALQVVNCFFFAGLFADLFGAAICFLTGRWLDLLTVEELVHLDRAWVAANVGTGPDGSVPRATWREYWVAGEIRGCLITAWMGFFCFVAGLMVYIWAEQPRAVQITSSICCGLLVAFVFPIILPHRRIPVMYHLRLKRLSD